MGKELSRQHRHRYPFLSPWAARSGEFWSTYRLVCRSVDSTVLVEFRMGRTQGRAMLKKLQQETGLEPRDLEKERRDIEKGMKELRLWMKKQSG